jgi:hypothetical protein
MYLKCGHLRIDGNNENGTKTISTPTFGIKKKERILLSTQKLLI